MEVSDLSASPAAEAVGATYELIENIISFLPASNILLATKVSQSWLQIVERSSVIRKQVDAKITDGLREKMINKRATRHYLPHVSRFAYYQTRGDNDYPFTMLVSRRASEEVFCLLYTVNDKGWLKIVDHKKRTLSITHSPVNESCKVSIKDHVTGESFDGAVENYSRAMRSYLRTFHPPRDERGEEWWIKHWY